LIKYALNYQFAEYNDVVISSFNTLYMHMSVKFIFIITKHVFVLKVQYAYDVIVMILDS
jgi:hypothetical protein